MRPFNPFSIQNEWKKIMQNPNHLNLDSFLENFMKQFDLTPEGKKTNENNDKNDQNDENDQIKVFESFDHIYIQINVPKEKMKTIKVVHTIDKLFIYHNTEKTAEINLPSLVSKNGGSAQIEDHILQIRLVKVNDIQSIELNID